MLLVIDVISESCKDRFWPEIRVDNEIKVLDFKDKLYLMTGTNPSVMKLVAFNPKNPGEKIFMDDDSKTLGYYSIDTGYTIEVKESKTDYTLGINGNHKSGSKGDITIDYSSLAKSNPKLYEHYLRQMEKTNQSQDESTFQRYKINEEDYQKRNTGVREFINRMRAKNESKNRVSEPMRELDTKPEDLKELSSLFPLDSRCVVYPGNVRGTVKFVGKVNGSTVKVGVCLDEPMGDSDGRCEGRRFFHTNPNYGGFFDPANVKVGDYPPQDPFDLVQ